MIKNTHIFEKKQALSEKYSQRKSTQQEETLSSGVPETPRPQVYEQASAQAPIHKIQAGGQASPFFLLHGNWTGGVPFYCYMLARTLGSKQPFYVLDPYNYKGPSKPMSIEEMAAQHLKSLRAIQPEGPYKLGGFCNGSLIVYEMACQLQAQGQKVDLLVLIAPTQIARRRLIVLRMVHSLCDTVRIQPIHQLIGFLRIRHLILHTRRKFSAPDAACSLDFPKLLAIDPRLQSMFPPNEALLNEYVGVFSWLATLYKKSSVLENVKFIWFAEEIARRYSWSAVEKDNDSAILPGYHMQGVTDYIDQLAGAFKTILQRAHGMKMWIQ